MIISYIDSSSNIVLKCVKLEDTKESRHHYLIVRNMHKDGNISRFDVDEIYYAIQSDRANPADYVVDIYTGKSVWKELDFGKYLVRSKKGFSILTEEELSLYAKENNLTKTTTIYKFLIAQIIDHDLAECKYINASTKEEALSKYGESENPIACIGKNATHEVFNLNISDKSIQKCTVLNKKHLIDIPDDDLFEGLLDENNILLNNI